MKSSHVSNLSIQGSPAKAELPMAAPRPPVPRIKEPETTAMPANSIEKTTTPPTPRERAEADYRRAQSLLSSAASGPALESLRSALKQDAGYTPARQLALKLLLESRQLDEATALLQEGLELQPGQTAWAMSLARLQVERGDLAGAEHTLVRFRPQAGGSAEYAGFHGHLLNRLGQYRDAVDQYQAATRAAPAEGRWWFGLGQALEGAGRAQEARGAFRRALETGSLNADLAVLAEQKAR